MRTFIFTIVLFPLSIFSQVTKIVNVVTAGTLSSLLTVTEKSAITDLTITGSINADDFYTLNQNMKVVQHLDITGASIVISGDFGENPAIYNPVSGVDKL